MKMLGTGGSTATSLMDGTVLFLGREQSDGPAFCTYLYDSASGKWPATGPMNEPRQNHTATLLADGKVLAVGGQGIAFPGTLSSAELYNPSTKIWTKIPDLLTVPRSFHTATLLPNGKVLIAGGSDAQVINGRVQDYSSTELYDPQLQKGDDKDSPLR
jgi:N-acetylneuraminic acid mutarotase